MAGGEAEASAPLVESIKVYFEGCPGCAVDRRKAEDPGIPYWHFFHIWIIILVSCASYMLGRALTSTAWGMVADRIGRKPAYAVEVCRTEHQAIGLSLVSTAWAIGLIIGPAIGGYLAQPTEKYPKLFPVDSIFGRFPYFLPCLIVSLFCFVILISCIWLPETLHKHKLDRKEERENEYVNLDDPEEITEKQTSSTTNKNLFKNWPLMSSIILFCVTSFDDMAYTEIFSLWAESDKKYGGLSFSSEDVGQVLVVTGIGILLYQTFMYPHIVKVLGPINSSRVAAILSMGLLFTYPPMTHLSRPWLLVAVNIASVLKNNFVVTIVTCSFILPNNSVDQRATANGLATTLMSFFKAFAPAGAGIVFSWAQKRHHASLFPGDQMVFFLLDIIVFVELIWTFKPFLATPEHTP